MIEILPDVFYDPSKEWYEQDPLLIALAEEVMQGEPKGSETETGGGNSRLSWATWEHTTVEGTFDMTVTMVYTYPVTHRAFLGKRKHDQITIIQL